jgi:hypothetical protein
MNLKPHDVYVVLKILSLRGKKWVYAGLAESLSMSPSETNAAVKRATECGLIRPALGAESNPQPIVAAMSEFLTHGIRFVFPARIGGLVRGVPTGFSAPGLENVLAESGESVAVWPWSHGTFRGYSLDPLFRHAPAAVQDAPRFHAYLALADVLRQSSSRGREIAASRIVAMMEDDA